MIMETTNIYPNCYHLIVFLNENEIFTFHTNKLPSPCESEKSFKAFQNIIPFHERLHF